LSYRGILKFNFSTFNSTYIEPISQHSII